MHVPQRPLHPPSSTAGLPPILDDLVGHVLHACHGDTWSSKIGGIAALGLLMNRLPAAYLRPWSPQILAAVSRCMQVRTLSCKLSRALWYRFPSFVLDFLVRC